MGPSRNRGQLAGKEKPTVSVREPWVFGKRTFSLRGENLHGWDGSHVRLTGSALSGGALEDSRADDVAASWAWVVDRSADSAGRLDLDSFSEGNLLGHFVGLSTFWSGINSAGDTLVFGDFFVDQGAVFTADADGFTSGAASTESAGRNKESEEAEAHCKRDFFHKGVVMFRSVKVENQTTGWFVEVGFPIIEDF